VRGRPGFLSGHPFANAASNQVEFQLNQQFFFFGSLRDADIAAIVIGRSLSADDLVPAQLPGYRAVCVPEDTAPVLIADATAKAPGVLVQTLSVPETERLGFFESVDYAARPLPVVTESGERQIAQVWLDSHYTPQNLQPWHYEDWLVEHKPAFLAMTQAYMAHFESGDVAAAEAGWDAAHAAHMNRDT